MTIPSLYRRVANLWLPKRELACNGPFMFSPGRGCCGSVVCSCLSLEIAGISSGGCADCTDINGTWYAERQGVTDIWYGSLCNETSPQDKCLLTWLSVTLSIESGDYILRVRASGADYLWEPEADTGFITWSVNLGEDEPDCTAWDDLELAYEDSDISCNLSSSTVTVNPVSGVCNAYFGCQEECYVCIDEEAPNEILLTLDGVTSPSPDTCTDCEDLDGQYVLSWVSSPPCTWTATIDALCSECSSAVTFTLYMPGTQWCVVGDTCIILRITWLCPPGGAYASATHYLTKETSFSIDCLNLDTTLSDYSASSMCYKLSPPGYECNCDFSSATARIQAL